MKIIQSYWSLPEEEIRNKNEKNGRYHGGWLSKRYNYMSWALSCLKFKEFYNQVELYTDEKGVAFLKDKLELPYTRIENCLDVLNDYDSMLWAVGKIYTYSLQKEPFIHADSDIFIWKRFGDKFENQRLLAQSFQSNFQIYRDMLEKVFKVFDFIPDEIKKDNGSEKNAACAGIIGGYDIPLIQEYAFKSLDFINKNRKNLHKLDIGFFNTIAEEYFFLCLAKSKGIEVSYYKENVKPDFASLMRFGRVPSMENFIHLAGDGKRNVYACEQVEMRLLYEFPEYHKHITEILLSESPDDFHYAIHPERANRLKKIYKFLESSTEDNFLFQKFCLSKNTKITHDDEGFKIKRMSPQTGELVQENLNTWNGMLYYFSENLSGNDLLESLSNNESIINMMTHEQLKEKIIDLISENLMYTGILDFA